MPENTVIYEVNLTIAKHRVTEFDAWLREHIEHMLELPGFVDATAFDTAAADDDDARLRCVHYRLQDRAALERYFEEHAAQMRAHGVERFGDDMTASRRILALHRDGERCANCQALLAGQYCGGCGQRHRTRMISLWELVRDVFEDAFSWDSRVWRSLRPLLLSPGTLTAEYLDGRRLYYTPPLRMYLVLSITFFLLSSLPTMEDFSASGVLQFNRDAADLQRRPGVENRTDDAAESGPKPTASDSTGSDGDEDSGKKQDVDFDCDMSDAEANVPGINDTVVKERLTQVCQSLQTDEGRNRFLDRFTELLPKLLIVMLPFTALAGKLVYPLSKRYYVEHLLFYTHYHSFVFLLLILAMGMTVLTSNVDSLAWLAVVFSYAINIYAVYYLYRGLRRVFLQGRWTTILKMFLIGLSYLIGATMLALIGVAIAAITT